MNTLDAAFEQGEVLTTHEGKEYRKVVLVCVRSDSAPPMPYCTTAEWSADPIAVLARKDAEIALLKAEVEKLRTSLLDAKSRPITVEEALGQTVTVGDPPTLPRYSCPRCEFRSLSARGVSSHAWAKHKLRVNWGALGA